MGCSLPTVGGEIFDMYEGSKGWFRRAPCNTGKCIKKVEIEIVSDDGENSYGDEDDGDNDEEDDENTRVSKVRRSKRRGGNSGRNKQ